MPVFYMGFFFQKQFRYPINKTNSRYHQLGPSDEKRLAIQRKLPGHFAERQFADRHFAERTTCRTDILPNGHFAERTLAENRYVISSKCLGL
jgi:hypothetical protein